MIKTGAPTVLATSNITYTIVVTNFGPSTASNVVVSDVLPTNVTFIGATGGGVATGALALGLDRHLWFEPHYT